MVCVLCWRNEKKKKQFSKSLWLVIHPFCTYPKFTFSMSSIQARRSMPKSMKAHSMPSLWYSSCSSTNIWWLKNCCNFSFVKLMQSCSKPLNWWTRNRRNKEKNTTFTKKWKTTHKMKGCLVLFVWWLHSWRWWRDVLKSFRSLRLLVTNIVWGLLSCEEFKVLRFFLWWWMRRETLGNRI